MNPSTSPRLSETFSSEAVVPPLCSGTIALLPSVSRAWSSGPTGFQPVLEMLNRVNTATSTISTEALKIWM